MQQQAEQMQRTQIVKTRYEKWCEKHRRGVASKGNLLAARFNVLRSETANFSDGSLDSQAEIINLAVDKMFEGIHIQSICNNNKDYLKCKETIAEHLGILVRI